MPRIAALDKRWPNPNQTRASEVATTAATNPA